MLGTDVNKLLQLQVAKLADLCLRSVQSSERLAAESCRGGPCPAAVAGRAQLAADDAGHQLLAASRRDRTRQAADLATLVPATSAVGADLDLAVAVETVERVLGGP